jgi:hypothetical protein
MTTRRISPSSNLAETLRALALGRTGSTQRTSSAERSDPNDQLPQTPAKNDVHALRERLRDAAAQIDPGDPQSELAARNHIVSEILLWEFGSDFRKDSQYLPMVEAIGKTLDADAAFQQRFIELMKDLRGS